VRFEEKALFVSCCKSVYTIKMPYILSVICNKIQ